MATANVIAVPQHFAVRHDILHGKGAFAVRCTLCHAQNGIFISILFFSVLTFIF
jgi:hypothetical protein